MSCLSDLACVEWVRFGETRLAPEAADEVRLHLESCEECQRKVRGFDALERSVHPYGTPAPRDALAAGFRRTVLVLLAGALLYALWRAFF
ncbi:MAG: hypothetical protein VX913_05165 [Planctomycetota bacterium]|nr:hypothetical protein [Planctomycetota bacterium]MEE2712144.1 hypothetical protein [Planctomycetota bacterium]